jgi:hypothetical protein
MSSRRRMNSVITINVNNSLVEGVANVRVENYDYFENHFKSGNIVRQGVDNFNFKSLNGLDGGKLIKLFREEVVKQALWKCDNS